MPQNKAMHAEHAIGRFRHGSLTRACRVMAAVLRQSLMRYIPLILVAVLAIGCSDSADHEAAMDDSIEKALEDFRNRTIYRSLNVETLRAIPDDDLEQAIVDYVIHRLKSGSDEDATLGSLSEGNRALWLTWIVEGEVNNGGFNQYYWNTDGRYSSEAVTSFEFFAASEHAGLMREANSVRKQEADAIKEYEDKNTLDAFSDSYKASKLGPLDDRFYALTEDLSALRVAKIRQSPELFTGN